MLGFEGRAFGCPLALGGVQSGIWHFTFVLSLNAKSIH
jgi:hypothetical protein